MTFQTLKHYWDILNKGGPAYDKLKAEVPSLGDLSNMTFSVDGENSEKRLDIVVSGFDKVIDDLDHLPYAKKALIRWLRSFCEVRMRPSSDLMYMRLTLTNMKEAPVDEAVRQAFKRSGNKIVKTYICNAGS